MIQANSDFRAARLLQRPQWQWPKRGLRNFDSKCHRVTYCCRKKSYAEQLSSQYLVLFSQGSKDWPVWLPTKRATLIRIIPKCYNWIVQRASTGKDIKGKVIIYRLGRRRILWGITWFLGEQKGRSVVTENPKGGIAENFGKMKRGDHSSLLGKWRYGGGGCNRESHQSYYWGSNIYRGDRLNFNSFSLKSSHSPRRYIMTGP